MKKLKPTINHVCLLLASFCLYSGMLKAQENASRNISDSAATIKLASRLSISKEKATQIQSAFKFHSEEIDRLMKDKTINPKDRQLQLKNLLAQRQQVLNVTLTQAQMEQLKNSQPATVAKAQARRSAIAQRHQQQLNRTPHRESQDIPMDVLKPKVLPSEKQQ